MSLKIEVFQPVFQVQFCVLVTAPENANHPDLVGLAVLLRVSGGCNRPVACSPCCLPELGAGSSCDEALAFLVVVAAEAGVGGENGSSSIHCFHGSSRQAFALGEELNFRGEDSLQVLAAEK